MGEGGIAMGGGIMSREGGYSKVGRYAKWVVKEGYQRGSQVEMLGFMQIKPEYRVAFC